MWRAVTYLLLGALVAAPGVVRAQEEDDPLAIPPDDEEPEFTIIEEDEPARPKKPKPKSEPRPPAAKKAAPPEEGFDDEPAERSREPAPEPEPAAPEDDEVVVDDPDSMDKKEEVADPEPDEVADEPAGEPAPGRAGTHGDLGVGIISSLASFDLGAGRQARGLAGPALVYQADKFHLEGIVSFGTGDEEIKSVAGRFWYHVHERAESDFSLGGGLGVASLGEDEPATVIAVELGAELRYLLVSNVSVAAAFGLRTYAGDAEGNRLLGDLVGTGGVVYFF